MPYLNNAWYAAMWAADLQPGRLVGRVLLDQPVVCFRSEGGEVVALTDLCPHRFVPLHLGKLLPGDRVQCGYHGLEFAATGECVKNPHGAGRIAAKCRVKAFPACERHSVVWVWMGDEPADPSHIPDYQFLDEDSGYAVTRRDFIRIEANYRLVADNLMDLSHSPFLHDGVIGGPDTVKADIRVEQAGRTVSVHRPKYNARPPGLVDRLFRQDGERVDIWSTISWRAPCYILNDTGAYPIGGERSEGAGLFGAHLLTPETEHSTLYHFAAARTGQVLDRNEDPATVLEWLSDVRRFAFEKQDEPMIKAQQRMRSRFPALTSRPSMLEIDAGPVRCNRVLDSLIAEERERSGLPSA